MKSGPLCAFLCRILTWYSRKQVTTPTHSRWLNIIAHKLSSLMQLDRADRLVPPVRVFPSNMLLVAPGLSGPVFATWLNNKLSQQASLGTDPLIWTMIQSTIRESGPICLPTGSHLGQEVEKLQVYPCREITLDCSKWPNMPGSGIS